MPELHQLRKFVTLAEELNYRRAAERLFITQPSLSHQIALLEASLGVKLFRRDRRSVSLTGAGQAILEDARQLLAESQAFVLKVQRVVAMDSAVVRVGFQEFANRTFIPDVLCAFRRRHPGVRLRLIEGYSRNLVQDLRLGGLDVAFIMLPAAADLGDLQVELVLDEAPGLLLAATHRLAELEEIPVEAVAGEQLLLADRSVNPSMYDSVAEWLRQSGREPRFFPVGGTGVYTYDTALRLIESGEAVSLGPPSIPVPPGVVCRPIKGSPPPPFRIAAVWANRNRSAALSQLLEVAREMRSGAAHQGQSAGLTA